MTTAGGYIHACMHAETDIHTDTLTHTQTIKKTAELIAKAPVEKSWPLNCNRSRHREQGPAIFLKTLGIIQKKNHSVTKLLKKLSLASMDLVKMVKWLRI